MRELIVDSFAGGGGASTGIERALGISPDIAINHDAVALAMHAANHPDTLHLPHSIWKVDPLQVCDGRPVGLLWASPDCKHFSKAKGGKPVEKSIRDLAWVVVRWARQVKPRVIILENVEEFQTWGPLAIDGRPCPERKGATFKRWVNELKRLGYRVEHRELRACDYGAPTIRKRLFLIARRDGLPIVWPKPTHGGPKDPDVAAGNKLPWRTAAEIIDWSLPCPSIFDTAAEIMERFGLRAVRPLQPATMARIAKGVKRYVLDAAKPFIVNLTHQGGDRTESIDDPIATITGAHRGEKALAVPFVAGVGGRMGQTEPRGIDLPAQTLTAKADSVVVTPFVSAAQQGGSIRAAAGPMHTITASAKDQNQIIVPTLIQTGYGEREGQEPRVPGLDKPLGTTVAGGVKHALIAPVLSAYYGEGEGESGRGASVEDPLRTQTTENRHALIAPHLTKFHGGQVGASLEHPAPTVTSNSYLKRPGGAAPIGIVAPHLMTMRNAGKPFQGADQPAHTVTAGGAHMHLVAAFLAQHNISRGDGINPGRPVDAPVSTILHTGSHQGLVAANLLRQFGTGVGSSLDEPARTVMADGQGKTQLSAAFLQKYYGTGDGQTPDDPLHTVTTKDRAAIVTVMIEGEPYVINDIGMRMLIPRELFRAQGFPESYIIAEGIAIADDEDMGWKKGDRVAITKTQQVSKCGNSVPPPLAEALVRANFAPREIELPDDLEFTLEAAE
jgi:DNA (cytosine-5)-methyltransferase 1